MLRVLSVSLLLVALPGAPGCGNKKDEDAAHRKRAAAAQAAKRAREAAKPRLPPIPKLPARPAVRAEAATFAKAAPAVGTVQKHSTRVRMVTSHQVAGQRVQVSVVTVRRQRHAILATKGLATTKVRVTYTEWRNTVSRGDQEQETKNPLTGKTYIVERKGARVLLYTPRRRNVYGPLGRTVRKEFKRLGDVEPVVLSLPATPIQPGAEVPAIAKAFREVCEMDGPSQDPTARTTCSKVRVTFRGRANLRGVEVGVFDISALVEIVQGANFELTMHMTGWMALKIADGLMVAQMTSGKLDVMGVKNAGWIVNVNGIAETRPEKKK